MNIVQGIALAHTLRRKNGGGEPIPEARSSRLDPVVLAQLLSVVMLLLACYCYGGLLLLLLLLRHGPGNGRVRSDLSVRRATEHTGPAHRVISFVSDIGAGCPASPRHRSVVSVAAMAGQLMRNYQSPVRMHGDMFRPNFGSSYRISRELRNRSSTKWARSWELGSCLPVVAAPRNRAPLDSESGEPSPRIPCSPSKSKVSLSPATSSGSGVGH